MNETGWFDSGTATVRPEWIDYNGHMNVGFYSVAFDLATEAICQHLDIGETHRRAHDHSIYVLEAHVTYDREVHEDAPLEFRSSIIDHDKKRFHVLHRMFHANQGFLAATNELMCMYVDLSTKRSAEMPVSTMTKLEALYEDCGAGRDTPGLGRKIAIRR